MRGSGAVVATLSLALVACVASIPASPTPEPTIPAAPALPDGWQVVASDAGDVRLAAPPDLVVLDLASGILLQGEMDRGTTPIQVWATGPRGAAVQPTAGESLRAWLEASTWIPAIGASGITNLADVTEREVSLPAGRALEVSMTVQPGTAEASRVIAYAIETAEGFVVLQILGRPDVIDRRRADISLLPRLVSFGE